MCVLPAIDTARGTTQLLVEAEYEDPHATVLASSNLAVEKTGPPQQNLVTSANAQVKAWILGIPPVIRRQRRRWRHAMINHRVYCRLINISSVVDLKYCFIVYCVWHYQLILL